MRMAAIIQPLGTTLVPVWNQCATLLRFGHQCCAAAPDNQRCSGGLVIGQRMTAKRTDR